MCYTWNISSSLNNNVGFFSFGKVRTLAYGSDKLDRKTKTRNDTVANSHEILLASGQSPQGRLNQSSEWFMNLAVCSFSEGLKQLWIFAFT